MLIHKQRCVAYLTVDAGFDSRGCRCGRRVGWRSEAERNQYCREDELFSNEFFFSNGTCGWDVASFESWCCGFGCASPRGGSGYLTKQWDCRATSPATSDGGQIDGMCGMKRGKSNRKGMLREYCSALILFAWF